VKLWVSVATTGVNLEFPTSARNPLLGATVRFTGKILDDSLGGPGLIKGRGRSMNSPACSHHGGISEIAGTAILHSLSTRRTTTTA
jgi:hypothetical protein